MQKLYAYIDEAGQHTEGRVFVVAVVLIDGTSKRDALTQTLETIEEVSRKRKQKWHTSRHEYRFAYLTAVLSNSVFQNTLFYQTHFSTREYLLATVRSTATAIHAVASSDYKATILVDGLPDSQTKPFGSALRRSGIKTDKTRGIDDEQSAYIRLADALCGLVIDAYEGNALYSGLLEHGRKQGYINELGK